MFGYIRPDVPNMFVKDTVLYRSVYCGLCKGIGAVCGTVGRFTLNYDLAFLSLLLHNVCGVDVKIEKQHCILHRFRKRPIAVPDELTKKVAAFNVILAYYKACDDVIDGEKGGIKKSFLNKAHFKAKKLLPDVDKAVKKMYQALLNYEKTNGDSIDAASDYFGKMTADCVKKLAPEVFDENMYSFAYNLGKWIYLIDALDDVDKDKKNNNYNVFINLYPKEQDKQSLVSNNTQSITDIFSVILGDIATAARGLKYNFNHNLIDNIVYYGLREQTKCIMENKKCKNTMKF